MSAQAIEVELPPLHAGQLEVYDCTARFIWLAAGRRWGKTILGGDLCTETAADGGRAWWVAPSYKMAGVGWRELRNTARQIPHVRVREAERLITYPGGGELQVRSADDPDSLRGDGLDLVVVDEAAFIRERAWTEALQPALGDREGRALLISTPKGRTWFWRGWQAALIDETGESAAFHYTTFANPYYPDSEKARLREGHAAGRIADRVFRQEYLAEFIDDTGGVFRGVVEAATAKWQDDAAEGHVYVIGVDWGKLNDSTVFAVFDATEKALVHIDAMSFQDYTLQRGRLEALAQQFKPVEIVAETNSMGEPILEELRRADLPIRGFTTTHATKNRAVEDFALAFESGSVRIVPDEGLIAELQAFEATRLPAGGTRYAAPAGMHDDRVMAAAIGWTGVSQGEAGCLLL